MEDRAESYEDRGGPTQEVLEENNISNRARGLFLILVKSMALFCPHSKNFPEAKLRSNGLTSLVEEISRQFRIASITELLVIILMQDYNEERARGTEM